MALKGRQASAEFRNGEIRMLNENQHSAFATRNPWKLRQAGGRERGMEKCILSQVM